MNNAQTTNLIVSLVIAATSGFAAKIGINLTDYTKDVEDAALLVIGFVTWLTAHIAHSTKPTASTTTASSIPVKSTVTLALGFALIGLAGCAQAINPNSPAPAHVVNVQGNVKQIGLGTAPQTGNATLGYQAAMANVTTVPCQIITATNAGGTNSIQKYITPNVALSYEINGGTGLFSGAKAASTFTLAIGDEAVRTLLGGNHLPINSGTNITYPVPVYAGQWVFPVPSASTNAVTSATGTNAPAK